MLMPQINKSYSIHNLSPLRKPLANGATKHYSSRSSYYSSAIIQKPTFTKKFNPTRAQSTSASNIKPISVSVTGETTKVEAVIKIQPNNNVKKFVLSAPWSVNIPIPHDGFLSILPGLIRSVLGTANAVLQFETPKTIDRDSFSWLSDEEFCRQMLAGINPYSIQLVAQWPLMSKLDPEIYGPAESAITKEIVEKEIKGFMTFDEALAQKKLFMLDYHDLLLPYVTITRDLKGTTLYGSRTLMFLSPAGTLMPIAIELTRPKSASKSEWKHVYTPTTDATNAWLWKLAKAHVLAHDSGIHQLLSHWLRTHCATEPYIIATHRNLSQMHPIYRLLIPYFRYTMQINALARQYLIEAGGTIESSFSTGKYSMQLSSDAYDKLWRFDHEALPADLISRGMAVKDQNEPHGLKLTIEDYPFANDGLLLWDAIKEWATSYVKHYYPQANLVESDEELQAWWDEIRTVGHGDKKDEPWLFPQQTTIARTKMPNEDKTDEEWKSFIERPEHTLLKCLPSKIQAVRVMVVLNVLSTHSPDERYIGRDIEEAWKAEPAIKAAFEKFQGRLKEIEDIIDTRNANPELRNRSGARLVPYQLLKPNSVSGVTGMGVPNSISI
ncbi:linoleate 13S-lipoxygenase 2-1, chloroplastic-like protein [Tanacetum coccineum]